MDSCLRTPTSKNELQAPRSRITLEERLYVHIPAVVPLVRHLVAAGAVRPLRVPAGVAIPIAVQDHRSRSRRSASPGMGNCDPAGHHPAAAQIFVGYRASTSSKNEMARWSRD